jgi:hypothetical protein
MDPRSIDKLYRESIESALEFWGMYQQKPAWYFNKKTQEFIENKDSENRENLPKEKHTGCIDSCRKPRLFILTKILLTELILGDQSFVAAP